MADDEFHNRTEARSESSSSTHEPAPDDGAEMGFLDHLEELRWRLIKSIIGIVVVALIAYAFSDAIIQFLIYPSRHIQNNFNLQILKVPDMLIIKIKVAVFTGLIGALPITVYQLWKFIAPGLLPREKQYVPATVIVVTFFFLLGGAFGYFAILPVALQFLTGIGLTTISNNFALDSYISFVTRLIFVTGFIFELPVLSFFLTKIGLITPALLRHYRRYAVVVIFVVSAFLTPPDPASMILMAFPMLLLYELSIWVSFFGMSKEARKALRAAKKQRKAQRKQQRRTRKQAK